ncbi:MAG: arginine--tRNA ligase [Acidimicrobiales bacterium]
MIRDRLAEAVRAALVAAGVDAPSDIHLERPARREHGDWSTNVALASAKVAGRPPRELAADLARRLEADPPQHVEQVEVAGPGFVNLHLRPAWLHDVLGEVVAEGESSYATSDVGAGERVQIEFVSANPTGPLHVGNGWWCAYGDSLARVLERSGHEVWREYYVNDTGGQISTLGESLLTRARGDEVEEGGYEGAYVGELAEAYDGPDDPMVAGKWAADRILDNIRGTLETIGVRFDAWFSQASIEESEAMDATIAELEERGVVFEEDGALWLDTGRFGDPREKRVLRRSPANGGTYTYLAGDIAYHRDKLVVRGFDRVINVWGADHAAQIASLKAGLAALGVEPSRLEVRLGQLLSLAQGRMSKRAGNAVALSELVDDIGPGAFRFLSLMSSIDNATTLDLDLVRRQTMDNPVYYVQMAHARIAGIGRTAEEKGIERLTIAQVDLGLLAHERELDVLRSLSELPDVVLAAGAERAPHKLATWVRELAGRFHGFYHDCYVIGESVSPGLTQARMWLVEAARIGLVIGLGMLGVDAPERM